MEKVVDRSRLSQDLIKSKQRVADHGEVFTPSWLIEEMLDLTGESDRVEARFLEPACGSGNFLIHVLQRKLSVVEVKCRTASYDKRHLSLLAVMNIYGIELLKDNIGECRRRMLEIFANYLKIGRSDELYQAASYVLFQNLVHGDALKMRTFHNQPIIFAEWEYLGKGKFQRRDFRLDLLTQASGSNRGTLVPSKSYDPMTIREIANSVEGDTQRMTL